MVRPLITLTTDFGLSDHYVGTMKGVILGIAPAAEIVDICHDVSAFEASEAAFVIAQAYPYFPKKSIHVVVVDPGVGTSRRPILMEACGQYFLAPDNGVLTMVANAGKHKSRSITNAKLFLPSVSSTFHGRDVFAPCAAHLARGTPPARFGKLIQDHLRLNLSKPFRSGKRTWTGTILKIDRFGNLVTNFETAEFGYLELRPFEMAVGLETVTRLARNYQEGKTNEVFLIAGSSGYLEISLNQGNAAKHLGCGVGAPAELSVW